jgi:KaiC/GvpD/RAD55 family RecA-like ATPase
MRRPNPKAASLVHRSAFIIHHSLMSSCILTGVPGLDQHLGGGLLPGTLTVVVGSTGIGKTQLGLQFARAGIGQEGRTGIVFDMSSRGDPQSHADYARRMFGWELAGTAPQMHLDPDRFFDADQQPGDYLHVFDVSGRRVTRRDLDFDAWHDWQAELAQRLIASIGFFYGNFTRGVRRAVIDGIEPVDRPSDSIQFELFEYVYHQILRKDPEWVARDLFREHYLSHAQAAARHVYDPGQIACILLYTSHETTLDGLIERPLAEGDILSNANTLIYLGKIRDGVKFRRALYIGKHRGSPCTDEILPYTIGDGGLRIADC